MQLYYLSKIKSSGNRMYKWPKDSRKLILAFRILLGSWLLMMIVLVNAYAGCMTALMTVTKLEPIVVNSLEELANNSKVKLTVAVNTVPANTFLVILIFKFISLILPNLIMYIIGLKNATNGTFHKLGSSLRKNPHLLMTREAEQAVDNVINQQAAYLAVPSICLIHSSFHTLLHIILHILFSGRNVY